MPAHRRSGRALSIAQQLDALNRERREIESGMQEQALILLESIDANDAAPGIALFDPSWHEGVVGILASRIKDKLHRPVFAFAPGEGGIIKGSGRSIPGLHLRDALDLVAKRSPGLLIRFGGHAMAAGATVNAENFENFRESFAQVAAELLAPADLTRTLETDGNLEGGYFSLETARLLENEIWGQGFPAPLFMDEFEVEQQRVSRKNTSSCACAKATPASTPSSSTSAPSPATRPALPTGWRSTNTWGWRPLN
jgi:single-stranded-DNA-specific exonuclease